MAWSDRVSIFIPCVPPVSVSGIAEWFFAKSQNYDPILSTLIFDIDEDFKYSEMENFYSDRVPRLPNHSSIIYRRKC